MTATEYARWLREQTQEFLITLHNSPEQLTSVENVLVEVEMELRGMQFTSFEDFNL